MAIAETTRINRFEVLDSLRGICACMIVFGHFQAPGIISQLPLVRHSFLFVDFFFVLSGFVIAASYGERLANRFSIGQFMGLRLGRIYPLHLAMLLLFLAFELSYAAGAIGHVDRPPFRAPNDPVSFVASLTLVQEFFFPHSEGWNLPSWSIQVEIWTYLFYALVFRWAGRFLVPVSLLLAAACAAYLYQSSQLYLLGSAFPRCIFGFALGVIAFRIDLRLSRMAFTASMNFTCLEVLAVVATIAAVWLVGVTPLSMAVPPVFFAVILIFAPQKGAVSNLLKRRIPLLLGELSYSIYMIHEFLNYRLRNLLTFIQNHSDHQLSIVRYGYGGTRIIGSPLLGDVLSIGFLAAVIGCAACTYRLIEHPARSWSRQRILGTIPPAPPPHLPTLHALAVERQAPSFRGGEI